MTEHGQDLIRIQLEKPLQVLRAAGQTAHRLPQEAYDFKQQLRSEYLVPGGNYAELFGGFRNLILLDRTDNHIDIFWRTHETRWPNIIRAVLTEHYVSQELDIPGRQLLDPLKPVEISARGHYMTRLRYVPGEGRYPWVPLEIESGAKLLSRLHEALRHITFDPKHGEVAEEGEDQWIHGDAARRNILFTAGTAEAYAVIDYENLQIGPREQDIARTVSLLMVDTQLRRQDQSLYAPTSYTDSLRDEFRARIGALIDTYPRVVPLDEDLIIAYCGGYLASEDYGDLNPVAQYGLEFLNQQFPSIEHKLPE